MKTMERSHYCAVDLCDTREEWEKRLHIMVSQQLNGIWSALSILGINQPCHEPSTSQGTAPSRKGYALEDSVLWLGTVRFGQATPRHGSHNGRCHADLSQLLTCNHFVTAPGDWR